MIINPHLIRQGADRSLQDKNVYAASACAGTRHYGEEGMSGCVFGRVYFSGLSWSNAKIAGYCTIRSQGYFFTTFGKFLKTWSCLLNNNDFIDFFFFGFVSGCVFGSASRPWPNWNFLAEAISIWAELSLCLAELKGLVHPSLKSNLLFLFWRHMIATLLALCAVKPPQIHCKWSCVEPISSVFFNTCVSGSFKQKCLFCLLFD